ncbi:MAG: M48 family metallopeptidase [Dehalococcoidia bacterium]|jgi:heat shock protein HtpX|nr:M48 family metallopeptidase [Chloroflexota bacterium]MCK4242908.1 M48 family metallopeptidase [Dehalococcoidia bacterium]
MWEQIRFNQIRSAILVAAMAVLLLVIGYFLGLVFLNSAIAGLIIALVIWMVMNLIAFFQGDNIFLALSKARKIERDDHPRLFNIVEEMRIASGLEKMPDIYIIDDPALNAFAAGRDPKRASIAVTSGLLQKLNRDELQGVIGHEMAHIKNRDVLLMAMCGVLLGTIVILAWYATRMLFFGAMFGGRRSSSGGGGQAQLIIFAVGIILMILAPIAAYLIYFAISRKREYLADASSALYTRYPDGLASALEKLGGSTAQLQSANQATAPMYIINPFRKKGKAASDLTSTHPPISERIRILRSMAGGASLADYDTAYRQVRKGRRGFVSASAIASVGAVGLREAEPEAARREPEPDKVERTREVSDLMWRLNDYRTIICDCGTKLKVPPKLKRVNVKCPHCGRINPI